MRTDASRYFLADTEADLVAVEYAARNLSDRVRELGVSVDNLGDISLSTRITTINNHLRSIDDEIQYLNIEVAQRSNS